MKLSPRYVLIGVLSLGVCTALIWGARSSWFARRPQGEQHSAASPQDPVGASTADLSDRTNAFCGACHAMPPASSFPSSAWRKEVEQGYDFFHESRRTDLIPPPQDQVAAWFESRAPDHLTLPDLPPDEGTDVPGFDPEQLTLAGISDLPAISHVHRLQLDRSGNSSLVYCDMHSGEVGALRLSEKDRHDVVLARLLNPCHVEACDLDQNGDPDLVVADLGSFSPADHGRGRVVWLHRLSADDAVWHTTVLQTRLGRVADVQPGDFDGDGDIDLLVAEFGWRKTGRILLLENTGLRDISQTPKFDLRVIDQRHGAIHVPAIDLDGDGRLDFVALISQEHEVIEAFLNRGNGEFQRETIYAAGDPSFGSTGIQLVDLDDDGDTDVLYTNGDAMDSFVVKPYHGVHWLENVGSYPFEYHHLAALPGASRAEAADLNRDGRLDVVAVAFLPDHVLSQYPDIRFDSIICLTQDRQREFTRHRIERGNLQHMSVTVAVGQESVDLWVGNFAGSPDRVGPRLTVWKNRGQSDLSPGQTDVSNPPP